MRKIKLIAETAWHHDGDYDFMKKLVNDILKNSKTDILKMHITLNYDEYSHISLSAGSTFKKKLFSPKLRGGKNTRSVETHNPATNHERPHPAKAIRN